jgi:hypothetical protein
MSINRLEQLDEQIPVTILIKWYNRDRLDHTDWRSIDQDDHIWYVVLFPKCFFISVTNDDVA